MPRKTFTPTDLDRVTVKLHAMAGTPHDMICQVIRNPESLKPICLTTLYKNFRQELDLGVHELKAKAVGVLARRLATDDLGAACFILKTRGADLWAERRQFEHSGPGGDAIPIQQNVVQEIRFSVVRVGEKVPESLDDYAAAHQAALPDNAVTGVAPVGIEQ